MLYRDPKLRLWDTTVFHDGARLHLLFIAADGVLGHAVSDDWVHWEEATPVVLRGAPGSWNQDGLVSNNVVMHKGVYHLFAGTKAPHGEYVVGLFTSRDCEHWEADPRNPILTADGVHYAQGPNEIHEMHPAWRDPAIALWPDGMFHLLLCARRPQWDQRTSGAVIAHMRSHDLRAWEMLPPLADVGARVVFAEVPGYFALNGRSYLHFLDLGWGGQRMHTPTRADAAGTFYLTAGQPEGPYLWPRDPLLIGADNQRMYAWAARVFQHDGETLLYSHINAERPSLALPKSIVERAPGALELRYSGHLARLERAVVISPDCMPAWRPRNNDLGAWHHVAGTTALAGRSDSAGTSVIVADEGPDLHVQARIVMRTGACAGLVVRAENRAAHGMINWDANTGVAALLDFERQCVELRGVRHAPPYGWGRSWFEAHGNAAPLPEQRVAHALAHGRPYHLRLVARDAFFELYLDDVWLMTMSMPPAETGGGVELLAERGEAVFDGLRLALLPAL